MPLRESQLPELMLKDLGKVKPSKDEVTHNPRSRSAVLRCAEKTGSTI
jgi:16S rRNA (cytosine1402-N4)-methyltransferase